MVDNDGGKDEDGGGGDVAVDREAEKVDKEIDGGVGR